MSQSYEIDMCHGPLFGKIIRFSIPLMLSGILQLLFNAADIIVVGRFVGSTALAAVGSTSSLINLLINLFIGFSVGANVLVARFHGAGRDDEVNETVHTAITLSMISGIFLLILGVTVTRTLLIWMGSPDDVLDQSSLYLKIYFLAMPATLLYNFGSSILRAVGDTKRPLFYLVTAGIINVCFNLFFVIVCHLGVAGVGLATVIAEYISAALIIRCLMRSQGCCHLDLHQLGIVKGKLRQIMQIGLPAGLQSVVFNKAAMAVDTHVFRVSHRIGLVPDSCTTPFSVEKELVKNIPEKLIPIAHHWLILHGRYVCQARTPKCDTCGLQMMCKYFCNTYKVTKEAPKAKNK